MYIMCTIAPCYVGKVWACMATIPDPIFTPYPCPQGPQMRTKVPQMDDWMTGLQLDDYYLIR